MQKDLIELLPLLSRLFMVGSMYVLVRSFSRWPYVYAMLCLPATMLHELSHLFVGVLVRAQPVGFSLLPKRVPGSDRLLTGPVTFTNLTWWRGLPVATAPLFLLLPSGLWIVMASLSLTEMGEALAWSFCALQCLMGCWPSPQDWRHAGRTLWVFMVIGITAIAIWLWLAGPLPFLQ